MNNSFNEIMTSVKNRYVVWIRAGLKVDLRDIKASIAAYKDRNDVATLDFKIMSRNDDIVSGGAYILKDGAHPLRIRCMGGGTDFYGYENALLYVRPVICSLGYCTVVDKYNYDSMNLENIGVSESIIRYSMAIVEDNKKNLFVPYYGGTDSSEAIKNELIDILLTEECKGRKDPYFNTDIIALCLE